MFDTLPVDVRIGVCIIIVGIPRNLCSVFFSRFVLSYFTTLSLDARNSLLSLLVALPGYILLLSSLVIWW